MTDTVVFTEEEIAADPILSGMRRDNIAITRVNYIIRNYGAIPLDWDAEAEADLPEQLQDWTQFEQQTK